MASLSCLFLPELDTKIVERRKERCDEAAAPKVPREGLFLLRELFRALLALLRFHSSGFVGGGTFGGDLGHDILRAFLRQDYGTGRGGPHIDPVLELGRCATHNGGGRRR